MVTMAFVICRATPFGPKEPGLRSSEGGPCRAGLRGTQRGKDRASCRGWVLSWPIGRLQILPIQTVCPSTLWSTRYGPSGKVQTPGVGPTAFTGRKGDHDEGSVLQVREELREADLELARQAQELCLGSLRKRAVQLTCGLAPGPRPPSCPGAPCTGPSAPAGEREDGVPPWPSQGSGLRSSARGPSTPPGIAVCSGGAEWSCSVFP